jgi:hypothetical protein
MHLTGNIAIFPTMKNISFPFSLNAPFGRNRVGRTDEWTFGAYMAWSNWPFYFRGRTATVINSFITEVIANRSGYDRVAAFCEHVNEPLSYTKDL